MIRKLVVNDGRSERELLMVGTIVVGRDPSCHITDIDPLLSRRHAEFVSDAHGVTIRDLNSRNGVLVNGDKMPERALRPGDVVQMGHLHVRYVEEHPSLSKEEESMARERTTTGTVPAMAVARPLETVPGYETLPGYEDTAAVTAPTRKAPTLEDTDTTFAVGASHASTGPQSPDHARSMTHPDETRKPGLESSPARDLDATIARSDDEETRAPAAKLPATKAAVPTEARVVANSSLIVMEASPSCQQIIGAEPDTILGGRLADALTRSLSFVTSGDGPSSLSLTVTRAASGRTITIVFKAGPPTGASS